MKRLIPLLIKGLFALAVGIYILVCPENFLLYVAVAFGAYMVLDGARSLLALFGLKGATKGIIISIIIKAAINILLGIIIISYVMANPGKVMDYIIYCAAFSFLISAVINIVDYFLLRRQKLVFGAIGSEGVLALAFALILFFFPQVIGSVALNIIAIILILTGTIAICRAVNLFFLRRRVGKAIKDGKTIEVEFKEL